jgi:hypothetical protein
MLGTIKPVLDDLEQRIKGRYTMAPAVADFSARLFPR